MLGRQDESEKTVMRAVSNLISQNLRDVVVAAEVGANVIPFDERKKVLQELVSVAVRPP